MSIRVLLGALSCKFPIFSWDILSGILPPFFYPTVGYCLLEARKEVLIIFFLNQYRLLVLPKAMGLQHCKNTVWKCPLEAFESISYLRQDYCQC